MSNRTPRAPTPHHTVYAYINCYCVVVPIHSIKHRRKPYNTIQIIWCAVIPIRIAQYIKLYVVVTSLVLLYCNNNIILLLQGIMYTQFYFIIIIIIIQSTAIYFIKLHFIGVAGGGPCLLLCVKYSILYYACIYRVIHLT